LVLIEHQHLRAIVLATGGVTSQAPSSPSCSDPDRGRRRDLTEAVHTGDDLIVDGNSGVIIRERAGRRGRASTGSSATTSPSTASSRR